MLEVIIKANEEEIKLGKYSPSEINALIKVIENNGMEVKISDKTENLQFKRAFLDASNVCIVIEASY